MDEPAFTFSFEENAPCPGMWTFRASFAEAMSINPQLRRTYSPIVDRISAWCEERFGKPGCTARWDYSRMGVFHFDDTEGAFEFRLTWC